MKHRPLLPAATCGILLLTALPATSAGELLSGPHAWKEVTGAIEWEGKPHPLYPEILSADPGLPSPYSSPDGIVTVTARLRDGTFALVPAMVTEGQQYMNGEDFPDLARTGLHAETALREKRAITGRSIEEITSLGRPGGLSGAGFLAADEEIISVLVADNRLVKALGLTHRDLAEPLFNLVNMMETDIGFVWTNHSWDGLEGLFYNGREIFLRGKGTKGGQKSIFDDGIEGAWDLEIWREPDARELAVLKKSYGHLGQEQVAELVEEIEAGFPGRLPETLTRHHRSELNAGE